ncbi:hypothetical protein [Maribacter aestuarii]|uniref:hypothetical protein n=1 Tax=Maribacter aestuarii TaxID=1130723 RepID=UPI00248BFC7C|nr:hypothetical protein [Maribacter aestuarii]
MKKNRFLNIVLQLSLALFIWSCSNDDGDNPQELEAWEIEVEQLKAATNKYTKVEVAVGEGFFDASGFVPNMGHHYILPPRIDGTFELEKPEILLYAPDANGSMEFVAVEYAVPIEDLDNPGLPPEGFTGKLDEWEINPNLSQWQLHVWINKENPDGIFAPHNSLIGD